MQDSITDTRSSRAVAVAADREKVAIFALKSRAQIEEAQVEGDNNPCTFMPIKEVSSLAHFLLCFLSLMHESELNRTNITKFPARSYKWNSYIHKMMKRRLYCS